MRTRSSYAYRPAHLEAAELMTALHMAEQDLGRLAALRAAIVRRRIDPPGWRCTFDDLLLEIGCAVTLLREQIDHYWPEPPAA
jgi:hypothetical protein